MMEFHLEENSSKKIHFMGIGGCSMSGIAELMFDHGYQVSGSDRERGKYTKHLEKIGIPIAYQQTADNIKDQDLFIYTDAIPESSEELQTARKTGKPCLSRGQFLGAIMKNYDRSISVSGSHGKSTTTSMITEILMDSKQDATILLGGSFDGIEGNVHTGSGDLFLAEGCEFKGNIRYYFPRLAIVLNIDEDHLDYYRNLDDIVHAFSDYMENLSESSIAVLNFDDPNCKKIASSVKGKVVSYGMGSDQVDYYAHSITFDEKGHPSFDVTLPNGQNESFHLQIIGRYNVYNATAAIAAMDQMGVGMKEIQKGIAAYQSLHRRMELIGQFRQADILTDYGHHPKEIQATLDALAEHKKNRLICVFQPFTYSRTRTLMDQFATAFASADEVIVTKILGGREVDDGSVHSEELVDRLKKNGVKAHYCETFDDCQALLSEILQPEDLVMTTGCGNIDQLAHQLVQADK